jgi:hypothetical protein
MDSYVAALRSGDHARIRQHWWSTSLDRDGFETMHLWVGATIHITQWAEFLEDSHMRYEIQRVTCEDSYCVIDFDWIPGGSASEAAQPSSHEMHYYMIREDGRWVLGNPIDVLSRDWNQHETEHLVFYYPAEIDIAEHLDELHLVDAQCARMLEALDLRIEKKIEYYKAESPRECGKLVSFPPANGYAAIQLTNDPDIPSWFDLVVSTRFDNAHEIMHVLTAKAGIPYVNAALSEGFAVAFGGTTFQAPELALKKTKSLIGDQAYIPLASLLAMPDPDFLRASYITYQEAGAFIRFLIETFGIAEVRHFCDEIVATDDMKGAARKTYGSTLEEIESMWHAYLEDVALPDVGTSVPTESEVVFSMTDPLGDDRGDGDYVYPTDDRFQKGVFDLREFTVLRDSSRVYFRLGLASLIEPVSYTSGGERFVPGGVIAIKKGDATERRLARSCHGVKFAPGDGFDTKIGVGFGVCLTDNFGKVISTTGDISDRLLNVGEKTVEFSLPISAIGEPNRSWSYFVGTGLMSDRAMDFFGGPIPVVKANPRLISGGNAHHGNPAFIDMLLPEDIDQSRLLGEYDAESGQLAVVPMIQAGS